MSHIYRQGSNFKPRFCTKVEFLDDDSIICIFCLFLAIYCNTIGESAREAVSCGVDGIMVSAHGGRQLDGVPAPVSLNYFCLISV